MNTCKCKKDGTWYYTASLFNLSKYEKRCKKHVGNHTDTRTQDEACATSSAALMVGDERVGLDMVEEAMEEEGMMMKLILEMQNVLQFIETGRKR